MKLALIPPLAALEQTKRTNYQLMLPHLLTDDKYYRTYREHCNDPDQFVIFDNGEAEEVKLNWNALLEWADIMKPDEFVIPDSIGELDATIQLAQHFLQEWASMLPPQVQLMFVAQGQNYAEVCRSIQWAASRGRITTIGIPRHLIKTTGDRMIRMRLVEYIQRVNQEQFFNHPPLQIHLLGASPLWVFEAEIAGHFLGGKIRGMDTSMPFVYGLEGVRIDEERPGQISRQKDYFNRQPSKGADNFTKWHRRAQIRSTEDNIQTMLRWVNGDA